MVEEVREGHESDVERRLEVAQVEGARQHEEHGPPRDVAVVDFPKPRDVGHRGVELGEDALRLVFAFARTKRVLRLDKNQTDALADLFPVRAPEARDLIDRLEAGLFDHDDENDLAEINAVLARLEEPDQRAVTRAYWVLRARAAGEAADDDDDFANEGPPNDGGEETSSSSEEG